jgi:L-asparagine transporter-like permease
MIRGYLEQSREDNMKAIASVIAVVCMLSAGSTVAAALPADGATLARLGQQVDAVVAVKKTKKPKTRTTGAPTPPPREPSQSY